MEKRKKILKILIISIVIIFILLGGYFILTIINNNSSKNVELIFWGVTKDEKLIQPIIDKYQKENPNIKITYLKKASSQYEKSLSSQLSTDQSPDIVEIHNTWTNKYGQYLNELPTSILNETEYINTYYNICLTSFKRYDNNIYGIPIEIDSLVIFYNKDIFEKEGIKDTPKNWDEFITLSQKLTKFDEDGNPIQYGAGIGSSSNVTYSSDIFSLMVLQNQVPITKSGKAYLSSNSRLEDALLFYTEFITKHKVWSSTFENDISAFRNGKVAMIFAPSRFALELGNKSTINYSTFPTPQIYGLNNDIYLANYWGYSVSDKSSNSKEAWKFIKYLTEQENLQTIYTNQLSQKGYGIVYSRKDMKNKLDQIDILNTITFSSDYLSQQTLLDTENQNRIYGSLITYYLKNGKIDQTEYSKLEEILDSIILNYRK